MNENEYIDYYCEHLLVFVYIDEKRGYYDNDIKTENYEHALHNAEQCGINKETFVNSLKFHVKNSKRPINIDALWKFSIIIWMWKLFSRVVMPEMGAVDQYLKLINNINQGLDVKEIVFIGRQPNKTKDINITLSEDMLIGKFFEFLYSEELFKYVLTEENISNYPKTHCYLAMDLLPKRTLAFQIARELTQLFEHLFQIESLDESLKGIVMATLANLNLAAKAANNTDYNKLFSDAKTGRLPICDNYYHTSFLQEVGVLPYSIIKNPDSVKERKTFFESAKSAKV
jgi:hypothetical protein